MTDQRQEQAVQALYRAIRSGPLAGDLSDAAHAAVKGALDDLRSLTPSVSADPRAALRARLRAVAARPPRSPTSPRPDDEPEPGPSFRP